MSTKIFVLKFQSSKSTTPPKDYILVLNEHLTPNEFIADLQEMYPAIPTAEGKLGIVLEGSYHMTPRQFLRYMMTTVAYTPEVEGGVCVPKLLGEGNGIKVVYGEGLEPTRYTPWRQSTIPEGVPSSANMGKLAKAIDAMKIGENLEPSASSRAKVKRNKTPPRPHPPTHENANHEILISLRQDDSMSPRINFPWIILKDVPQCGGRQESMWVESEILARLPDWLDPSTVNLRLRNTYISAPVSSLDHLTWNEDSFSWSEGNKDWTMSISADISW